MLCSRIRNMDDLLGFDYAFEIANCARVDERRTFMKFSKRDRGIV
jgi:hypothetical protein